MKSELAFIYCVFVVLMGLGSVVSAKTQNIPTTLKCSYDFHYVIDTTEASLSVDGTAEGNSTKIVSDHLILLCGGTASQCLSSDRVKTDSLINANIAAGKKAMSGLNGVLGMKFQSLKNFRDGSLTSVDQVGMTWFRVKETIPDFEWDIQEEWKEVAGYHVQKASCKYGGRNYVAWFAPEIPVSDGPWKFCGLPGLIFEVYDIPCQYYYVLTSIEIKEASVELPSKDYVDISLKKYYASKRLMAEDPVLYMSTTSSAPVQYRDANDNSIDPASLKKKLRYNFQEFEF